MGVAKSIEKMRTLHIALAIAAMILLSCTADLDVPENVSQNVDTAQVATAGAELAQETTQDGWGASRKLLGRRDVRRRRRRRRRWWGSWRERTQKNAARERANKERGAKAERINKERAAKERSAKERTNKERSAKERTNKERSNKERAAKESAAKERTRKAAIRREHSAKESNVKRERLAKERAAKAAEQAQKRRKVARERKGKEMRGKELRHKESAAKARIAKERKAKRQEKSSKREKKAKHVAEIRAKVLKKIEQTKKKAAELAAKGKQKKAEQAAKKAKARKEKGLKLQAENDNKAKAREAKKAEKKAKHEKVYKKGEKNLKSGKKLLKKFIHTKYKMSKADVAKVEKWCTKTTKIAGSLDGTLAAGSKSIRKMASFAQKACAREKRAAAKAAELKKKVKTKGATFKFDTSKPCQGGSGTFKKYLRLNQRVNVGVVPAGVPNVNIQLRSKADADAGLWTINKHNKRLIAIVNWRTGKIKSATAASIVYQGAKIDYSGYMGILGKHGYEAGNEYIRIKGKAKVPFMMTAFGY